MLWDRRKPLPSSVPTRRPDVPCADAVRQAALEASWRRDRQVAQRRIAWRWVVWYARRLTPPLIGVLGLVVLVAYVAGIWSSASEESQPVADSSPVASAPEAAPSGPDLPVVSDAPTVLDGSTDLTPLTLRATTVLIEAPSTPPPRAKAPASADTLSLKPETWLHSKEP